MTDREWHGAVDALRLGDTVYDFEEYGVTATPASCRRLSTVADREVRDASCSRVAAVAVHDRRGGLQRHLDRKAEAPFGW